MYWNCYIMDKTLAEETGRSFLLPYRRSSTPLPSTTEADEFEMWPPLPTSLAPMPPSVRYIVPRRGYIMSCFVWTCRLGMIVEDVLDMDTQGPPAPTEPFDHRFLTSRPGANRDPVAIAEKLSELLEAWRGSLPPILEVDMDPNVSPMPHHIVGLAVRWFTPAPRVADTQWYHTAMILLHSRFIQGRGSGGFSESNDDELSARTHEICSKSAEACVNLLAHLDRHKLLVQVSADLIHILSLATLVEAFDAGGADEERAHRAKVNFAQCCIWLRGISSNWPAASSHKVFFEGREWGGGVWQRRGAMPRAKLGPVLTPRSYSGWYQALVARGRGRVHPVARAGPDLAGRGAPAERGPARRRLASRC